MTTRELVLGLAFLLAFPGAITLTDRAASGSEDPDAPPLVVEGSARP